MNEHIQWHNTSLTKIDRQTAKGHRSFIVWLTGLSGSGKSTLANLVEQKLFNEGVHTYLLDGDNLRHGINHNLGFSEEDRKENIRRISEIGKLFVDAGVVIFAAAISPYEEERAAARSRFEEGEFIEVYVQCTVEECEKRDPKGLYQKARAGEIKNFTGISQTYEPPGSPEVIINTADQSIKESVEELTRFLLTKLNEERS
ncbi:adenylyl-sulfate kinase [Halobacillus sp. A5]|uniref:adenylyl-sulfate kinase n=1 Tax=Halobacillus sp. A5 TaxID=2880263 RepID=UPI0020A684A5|nr:adenylyl-sulfate kinase [Halobacillus sp. A5]MCP3028405.1 adenylyl-sulfate kinase [Halobacillus sp. A5]